MSEVRRPGDLSHLERLIDAWSREDPAVTQATAGRLRRLVSVSVLATILDGLDQGGQDRLAFKCGASMELRFGPSALPEMTWFSRGFGNTNVSPHLAIFAMVALKEALRTIGRCRGCWSDSQVRGSSSLR